MDARKQLKGTATSKRKQLNEILDKLSDIDICDVYIYARTLYRMSIGE